jgi:hypothetical protein
MGWPHERVLNVLIACWCYRPSKRSSLPSKEVGFTPIVSMPALGEKLGMGPQIDQPSCCGLSRELFFSGAVTLSNTVDDFMKDCYARTARDMYS